MTTFREKCARIIRNLRKRPKLSPLVVSTISMSTFWPSFPENGPGNGYISTPVSDPESRARPQETFTFITRVASISCYALRNDNRVKYYTMIWHEIQNDTLIVVCILISALKYRRAAPTPVRSSLLIGWASDRGAWGCGIKLSSRENLFNISRAVFHDITKIITLMARWLLISRAVRNCSRCTDLLDKSTCTPSYGWGWQKRTFLFRPMGGAVNSPFE